MIKIFIISFSLIILYLGAFTQTTDSLSLDAADTTSTNIITESPINPDTVINIDTINKRTNIVEEEVQPTKNQLIFDDEGQDPNPVFNTVKNISSPIYNDTIIVQFIKEKVTQGPDSLYFNILKIQNFKKTPVTGKLEITAPEGWNLITSQGNFLQLQPNDSAYIPVRLALNKEVAGGLSYVLNASFISEETNYSTNAYISIPSRSSWSMNVNKTVSYFNQYNESEQVKVKLSNKGNLTETIKLDVRVGKLLLVDGFTELNNLKYITIPSNKDTTIVLTIAYNNGLSYNDKKFFQNNWKESSVDIIASALNKNQKSSIWFKKLNSHFYGQRIGTYSPLNIGITCSNLLSETPVNFNAEAFGNILFPEGRDLYYRINVFGLGASTFNSFDFNRKLNFLFSYQKDELAIQLGNNIGGGIGIGISGYGIKAVYKIDKTSTVALGVMKSRFNNSFGSFAKYNRKLKKVSLRTGIGFMNREVPKSNLISGLLGGSYHFLKFHSVSIDLFGTALDYYDNNQSSTNYYSDTLIFGYGYRLGYGLKYKNLNFAASYQDYLKSASNSGNLIKVKSFYKFFGKNTINLSYDRRKTLTNNYFSSVQYRKTFYSADYGWLLVYIPTKFGVTYGLGPQYHAYTRQSLDKINDYITEIKTVNPKLHLSATYKLTNYKSISGFITTGVAYIEHKSEDPNKRNIKFTGKPNYSIGSTYNSKTWRLNASYNIGSVTDVWYYINYQINYPNYIPNSRTTQSIVVRPTYEKSFFEDKILLQLMANYIYFMPSNRENISLNSIILLNLNRGWSASLNASVFLNAVEDEERGRISSRSLNLQVGVRKSFDLQQPRLKHRNLTVICFHDLNGNKIKDENEPPLSNIQITFETPNNRNTISDEEEKLFSNFALTELVTSPDGIVYYQNIPEGMYVLNVKPLFNLKDLYNVNGEKQIINISSNTTYFIPFSESYKVKGRVIIDRDEFSSEGLVSPDGIRVTATDTNGEAYSVLTDNGGYYSLSVPQAQQYTIKVNNVFNEHFICEKNQYTVQFNHIKVINLDFKFIEKKRKVNFNSEVGSLYIFNSLNSNKSFNSKGFDADVDTSQVLNFIDKILDSKVKTPALTDSDFMPVSKVNESGIIFKIDVFGELNSKKTIGDLKTLPKTICIEGENKGFRYLSSSYKSYNDAKTFSEELKELGFENSKVVAFEDGEEISLEDAGVMQE